MKPNHALTVALLLFVGLSVGYLVFKAYGSESSVGDGAGNESTDQPITASAPSADPGSKASETSQTDPTPAIDKPEPEPGSESTTPPVLSPDRLVVYYFHGTARCRSCLRIEEYTHEAVLNYFPGSLEKGTLEWHAVNVDEPANQHFVSDFQLYTKSVVVVEISDGAEVRWKNLDRVWRLLGDREAFQSYIRDEVRAWMEELE